MAQFPMFPGLISLCWSLLSLYLNIFRSLKLVKVTSIRSSFVAFCAGKMNIDDPCTNISDPGCPCSTNQVISYCFLPSSVSSQPCERKNTDYREALAAQSSLSGRTIVPKDTISAQRRTFNTLSAPFRATPSASIDRRCSA